MRTMGYGRTGTQSGRDKSDLCKLLFTRPSLQRSVLVDGKAIGALSCQRDRERNQFLVFFRYYALGKCCLIKSEKSLPRIRCFSTKYRELFDVSPVIHMESLVSFVAMERCHSRTNCRRPQCRSGVRATFPYFSQTGGG